MIQIENLDLEPESYDVFDSQKIKHLGRITKTIEGLFVLEVSIDGYYMSEDMLNAVCAKVHQLNRDLETLK